jgi:hypothetical protein
MRWCALVLAFALVGCAPNSGSALGPQNDAGGDGLDASSIPTHVSGHEVAYVVSACGRNGNAPPLVGSKPLTDNLLVSMNYSGTRLTADAAFRWLKAGGLIVKTDTPGSLPGRLDAWGTVAQFQTRLRVTINYYLRPDGSQFYAPDRDPTLAEGLTSPEGLDDCWRDMIVSTPDN